MGTSQFATPLAQFNQDQLDQISADVSTLKNTDIADLSANMARKSLKPRQFDNGTNLNDTTYHTMLSITGVGRIDRITWWQSTSTMQNVVVKITIDGVVQYESAAIPSYGRVVTVDTAKTIEYWINAHFDVSLLVEAKKESTGSLALGVDYVLF